MTSIFFHKKEYIKTMIAFFVTLVDIAFLTSNTYKIPHGDSWSLIIAAIPFHYFDLYRGPEKALPHNATIKLDTFLHSYNEVYQVLNKIKGTRGALLCPR